MLRVWFITEADSIGVHMPHRRAYLTSLFQDHFLSAIFCFQQWQLYGYPWSPPPLLWEAAPGGVITELYKVKRAELDGFNVLQSNSELFSSDWHKKSVY